MIKHMVLFAFKDHVANGIRERILKELAELPNHYPQMQNWSMGENMSNRPSTIGMSYAFVVEFENEESLLEYLHSERHEAFVRDYWREAIDRQVIASYEY